MSAERPFTHADLEAANAEVVRWDDAWVNDRSNNPNKYATQRRNARRRVDEVTAGLKAQGDLPMTAHEVLCAELDRRFPNAESGSVVEHEGVSYRIRYFPLDKSRTGKSVNRWGHNWEKA